MAISQVSKGVYVISPNQVKKYKDSAAGEYTSVFTKERAQQFEMAQKQALLELELGSKQYAEEMKGYRDRLDALDARRKELEGLKVRVAEGRLDAKDAAAISALRESTARQKTLADNAAKKAERIRVGQGGTTISTSTSDSTGGGGGGGGRAGKGPSLGDVSADDEAELEAALAESAGDPAIAAVAVKARRDSKTLGSATPEDTDAQNFKVVNDLADMRVGSTGEDIDTATDNILLELSQTDPQFAASHARVTAKQAQIEVGSPAAPSAPTVRSSRSISTTTRLPDTTTRKYPGLGAVPDAPTVAAPTVADDKALQDAIDAQIAAVETDRGALDRPSMAGFDFITRAREVAAGRFGPTPVSSAFGQRNALDALLRADPSMRSAIMEQYARLTPPVTPPIATESTAATAPAASEIRPEAAALMTDAEKADFRRRLEERAELTSLLAAQKEAMAEVAGPSEAFRTAALTPMSPPRELPAPVRPQVVPPVGIVESLRTVRVPSGVTPPVTPPGVGRYTPGPVPVSVPMERPSAADAAPRTAAAAPEGFLDRLSRPLVANLGAQMAIREGEESAESTAAAKKTMADIKAAGAVEAFRGPKTGPGQTKEGYLLNRLEEAYTLAKRADKLSRVSASGPGKVAYDLYVANKAKGIPFSRTYEEITMTFSGDMSAMEKAHEAALALDIKDRDTAPGGK